MQVNIKDTSVLDSIKLVFKDSLNVFQSDVNSASSPFMQVIDDTSAKISKIRSIIHELSVSIAGCIGKISSLNSQLTSYESSASSARSSASSCDNEDSSCRNHYLGLAREYDSKASMVRQEISVLQAKLISLQSDKLREEAREQKAKSVLSLVRNEYDKYDNLRAEVNANSNNIFDSASKKIQNIKSSVQDYVDVQSTVSSSASSNESSSVASSAVVASNIEIDTIDDFEVNVDGDAYTVKPLKAGKRFKCSIEKNSAETDIKFNFKASSDSIELLSFSSNAKNTDMKVIDDFLLQQAKENNSNNISTWAEEDEINLLKSVGFEVKTTQIDGAEMYKKV